MLKTAFLRTVLWKAGVSFRARVREVSDYSRERAMGSDPSLDMLRRIVEVAALAAIQCRDGTFDRSIFDEVFGKETVLTPMIELVSGCED